MPRETFLTRHFGFIEPECDEDGLFGGCLVSKSQSKLLHWVSRLSMVTGIVGVLNGYVWLGSGTILGGIFGGNYWIDPKYSWRRTIDISWVQLMMWSHLWAAFSSPQMVPYYVIQLIGSVLYGISWYLHKMGDSWGSTFMHTLVHVCANSSLLLLYTS